MWLLESQNMKKTKRTLTPKLKGAITKRVEALMAERGLKMWDLSVLVRVSDSYLSRLLGGERPWTLDILERIAAGLNVSLGTLVEGPIVVPMVGEMTSEGIPSKQINSLEPVSYHSISPQEDESTLAKIYCMKVRDRSLLPVFPQGTILVAQKDTSRTIESENFVIYSDEKGVAQVRQIFIPANDGHIILKSLDQRIPDLSLPIGHISLCDRVLRTEYPPKK